MGQVHSIKALYHKPWLTYSLAWPRVTLAHHSTLLTPELKVQTVKPQYVGLNSLFQYNKG